MAFKTIETQEQFDELVKDRIERAKESARREVADLTKERDELLNKLKANETGSKDKDGVIEQLRKELEDNQKTVAELTGEIGGLKAEATKIRIARESGLPYEMASRLNGDTEEELKADAESLKGFISQKSAPLAGYEREPQDDKKSMIASMLSSMGE